jgi:hypothetical protein
MAVESATCTLVNAKKSVQEQYWVRQYQAESDQQDLRHRPRSENYPRRPIPRSVSAEKRDKTHATGQFVLKTQPTIAINHQNVRKNASCGYAPHKAVGNQL